MHNKFPRFFCSPWPSHLLVINQNPKSEYRSKPITCYSGRQPHRAGRELCLYRQSSICRWTLQTRFEEAPRPGNLSDVNTKEHMERLLSVPQHQNPSASNSDRLSVPVRIRNINTTLSRHQSTGSFPHEMPTSYPPHPLARPCAQ